MRRACVRAPVGRCNPDGGQFHRDLRHATEKRGPPQLRLTLLAGAAASATAALTRLAAGTAAVAAAAEVGCALERRNRRLTLLAGAAAGATAALSRLAAGAAA
eukprot:CAMPEP_0203917146 /NCGR_PEP_ID=MMETSP0359-20131031/57786_1 /ASSEMBLY_ACC=CAM_ASM_000338 /TAXON_ID=268821 /ORGANISM="Scrippsiella Hangoei, Strain SHTV-5" /LENGTH=102 /DNA_ID=CAMNT_0050843981 /DNA_START=205 /DNA_END=510 /DNA_ORIENTATION=+